MINLRAIDVKQLPSVSLKNKKKLPKISGIYFVIDSTGVIQYIGKSVNINNRWSNHHREEYLKRLNDVKIAYLYISNTELLLEIEQALIDWFNPYLNNLRIVDENKTKCKIVKKSIILPEKLAEEIKNYSIKEKRSFSAQIALWAEQKLNELKENNEI